MPPILPRVNRIRHNVYSSLFNGSFQMVALTMVSTFLPLYLVDGLKANNFDLAWFNSLPAILGVIASLVGLVGFPYLVRVKTISALMFLIARLSYITLALVPWFIHGPALPFTIIVIFSLSNFPQSLGNLGWQILISSLIPQAIREKFFSQRNLIMTVSAILVTIGLGLGLQFFNPTLRWPYELLVAAAGGVGIAEVVYLLKHHERVHAHAAKPSLDSLTRGIGEVFRNRRFLLFTISSAVFNLGWQLAWPLFNIYQIRDAHATGLWLAVFMVSAQLGQILTFRKWGQLAARYGTGTLLFVAAAGMGFIPALFVVSSNLWYLALVNFVSGFFLSGVTLLLFTELLALSPKSMAPHYISSYNVIIGLIAFVAPITGVAVLHVLRMSDTMLLSSILRWAGAILFLTEPIIYGFRNRIKQWPRVPRY